MILTNFGGGSGSGGSGGGSAFAWIQVSGGTAGNYVEAKIGDDTFGVGVYSSAGIAIIPVPKAGTYTCGSKTATVTTEGTLVEG